MSLSPPQSMWSSTRERKTNNMANISYTATGKKNSKKNPAIMVLTITTDNGESVQVKMEYTKKYG